MESTIPYRNGVDAHLAEIVALVRNTNDRVTEIEKHLGKINGSIDRHNEEIFGNEKSPGLVPEMTEVHDFIVSSRTSIKIIVGILSFIGLGNLILLATMVIRAV